MPITIYSPLCYLIRQGHCIAQPALAGSHANVWSNDLALPERCRPQQVFIFSPYGAETRACSWPSVLAKHHSPGVHLRGHTWFQTAKGWRGAKKPCGFAEVFRGKSAPGWNLQDATTGRCQGGGCSSGPLVYQQ